MAEHTVTDNQGKEYTVNKDGSLSPKDSTGGILSSVIDGVTSTVAAVTGTNTKSSSSKK